MLSSSLYVRHVDYELTMNSISLYKQTRLKAATSSAATHYSDQTSLQIVVHIMLNS